MQLFLQLSKLQGTTSYFDENVGRIGVKSDTVSIRKETNCFNQNVTMGSSFYNSDILLRISFWVIFSKGQRSQINQFKRN